MKNLLLSIALHAWTALSQGLNETYNTGVFAPENVKSFAAYHNRIFFEDCDKYLDGFAPDESFVQFCDGFDPCFTTRAGVMEVCLRTVGGDQNLHGSLTVLPRASPWPYYKEVLVIGKQSFCEDIGTDVGFGKVTPLCFDFATENQLQENNAKEYGLEVVSSRGFYDIAFGSCPGFEPLDCNGEAEEQTENSTMMSKDEDEASLPIKNTVTSSRESSAASTPLGWDSLLVLTIIASIGLVQAMYLHWLLP